LGIVKIRLIGARESVRAFSSRFSPRLQWNEYPLYKDKERTQVDEERIALYATAITKSTTKSSITLDNYVSEEIVNSTND
jgi:hypothetical protein